MALMFCTEYACSLNVALCQCSRIDDALIVRRSWCFAHRLHNSIQNNNPHTRTRSTTYLSIAMTTPIIIVTGANRGIGQALCHKILSDPSLSASGPFRLFATSRKGEDLGFQAQSQNVKVQYPKLDISDSRSIQGFAAQCDEGSVRALINNAGVNLDDHYGVENAKKTLDVNYRGTLEVCDSSTSRVGMAYDVSVLTLPSQMCQRFIPLLAPDGRIVNLSSVASSLKAYSEDIQRRFRNPNIQVDDLERLSSDFLVCPSAHPSHLYYHPNPNPNGKLTSHQQSVSASSESQSGFVGPGRSYSVSKACVNAITHMLARDNPELTINAVCPGWVATDMGAQIGRPPKKPEEGARVPFRVAFGDIGGVTGRYWANDSVRSREEGRVQEW